MEMNAYYEGYLDSAQETLGNMMDYAVNTCGMDAEEIFGMFLSSGVARQFGKGNPRYVAGMTGAELAKEVVCAVEGKELSEPEEFFLDKSPEYWCGWILAYYQWSTGRSFHKIHQVLPIKEVLYLYPTHHEADVARFAETADYIYKKRHKKTYLQQFRENMGMEIKELAEQARISEAMIAELEGDFLKIQKADTLVTFRLSQILGCDMEELMEL